MPNRRKKGRSRSRYIKNKATQIAEWLYIGVKFALSRLFDNVFGIFFFAVLTPLITPVAESIVQFII